MLRSDMQTLHRAENLASAVLSGTRTVDGPVRELRLLVKRELARSGLFTE